MHTEGFLFVCFEYKTIQSGLRAAGFFCFSFFFFWLVLFGGVRYTYIDRTYKDSRLVLGFLLVLRLIKLAKFS